MSILLTSPHVLQITLHPLLHKSSPLFSIDLPCHSAEGDFCSLANPRAAVPAGWPHLDGKREDICIEMVSLLPLSLCLSIVVPKKRHSNFGSRSCQLLASYELLVIITKSQILQHPSNLIWAFQLLGHDESSFIIFQGHQHPTSFMCHLVLKYGKSELHMSVCQGAQNLETRPFIPRDC